MRGTLQCRPKRHQPTGIIPAYAGNTGISNLLRENCRDHPRVCGEHNGVQAILTTDKGSSPRMRGTHGLSTSAKCNGGIIPAYAGNTYWKLHELYVRRDHPRVCGEHPIFDRWPVRVTGSSPRMRGTPELQRHHRRNFGIIPAYAGNTALIRHYEQNLGDHPRVCGEHLKTVRILCHVSGSSPRMRGTPIKGMFERGVTGIIPAYAGNTALWPWMDACWRDHPRVCGEHTKRLA